MATLLVEAMRSDAAAVRQSSVIAGRYRVEEVLGTGSFGSVFAATHTGTGQQVAVKVLTGGDPDSQRALMRFFKEARVTAGLSHPNTVRVLDFGQEDSGLLYMVLERLVGRNLKEEKHLRLNRGEVFTEKEAIWVGIAITRSLAEAHAAGLVHRDLKPENIFLHDVGEDQPVVKVLDFGVAKDLDTSITRKGHVIGTPAYMSPEQVQNHPLDGRSDLYALGVLLYEMVCGEPPYSADSPIQLALRHATDPVPDPRDRALTPLSNEFVEIVRRVMAKKPKQRFKNAPAMRIALEECLSTASTEEQPSLRVQRPQKTRPLPVMAEEPTPAEVPVPAPEPDQGTSDSLVSIELESIRSRSWIWVVLAVLVLGAGGVWAAIGRHGGDGAETRDGDAPAGEASSGDAGPGAATAAPDAGGSPSASGEKEGAASKGRTGEGTASSEKGKRKQARPERRVKKEKPKAKRRRVKKKPRKRPPRPTPRPPPAREPADDLDILDKAI